MRTASALLTIMLLGCGLFATLAPDRAEADPYRWCAVYGAGGDSGGGSSNCYFLTLEQCRLQISGMGGWCEPNQFYDGRPVVTPEDRPVRSSTKKQQR